MKKLIIIIGAVFLIVCGISLSFSPDLFSGLIITGMCLIVAAGFIFGMVPVIGYTEAFRHARGRITDILSINAEDTWIAQKQIDNFFANKALDGLYADYQEHVDAQKQENVVTDNIDTVIDEESLALRSWQSVISQIPGTLTALGLIGTFLGLITGISHLTFGSVDATIVGITSLIDGIETAFYTSIIGVLLSVLFNLVNKLLWNVMARELGLFYEDFHMHILPSEAEQRKWMERDRFGTAVNRLEQIPRNMDYYLGRKGGSGDNGNVFDHLEQDLLSGRFRVYVAAKCDLSTGCVSAGEAILRWDHPDIGLVSPEIFLPEIRNSGYDVRLSLYLWERVFHKLGSVIADGGNPWPVILCVGRNTLLAGDVAETFISFAAKYQVPPKYVQVRFEENAYTECETIVLSAEAKLRQSGFVCIFSLEHADAAVLAVFARSAADEMNLSLRNKDASELSDIFAVVKESCKDRSVPISVSQAESGKQITEARRAGFSGYTGTQTGEKIRTDDEFFSLRRG